jgi:hypothetical protein
MPDAAAKGLERAADVSGKTVPVAAPAAGADRDEDADEAEDAPADETDQPEADEAEDAQAAEHPDNHGAAVSAAAHADTPAGFANHGQYVRSVATANHGHASDAERGKSGDKGGKPTP